MWQSIPAIWQLAARDNEDGLGKLVPIIVFMVLYAIASIIGKSKQKKPKPPQQPRTKPPAKPLPSYARKMQIPGQPPTTQRQEPISQPVPRPSSPHPTSARPRKHVPQMSTVRRERPTIPTPVKPRPPVERPPQPQPQRARQVIKETRHPEPSESPLTVIKFAEQVISNLETSGPQQAQTAQPKIGQAADLPSRQMTLSSPGDLAQGIIYSEILGRPLALRPEGSYQLW